MSAPDSDANDIVTFYAYDPATRLPTLSMLPDGKTVRYHYDSVRHLVKTEILSAVLAAGIPPRDIVSTSEYGSGGFVTRSTDALGNVTEYSYSGGYLVRTAFGSGSTDYRYDVHGNVVSVTDALGNSKTATYDGFDRLMSSVSAEGVEKRFRYDANNNRISEETVLLGGNTAKTAYGYDVLDHLVSTVSDVSQGVEAEIRHSYDAGENPVETRFPNGTRKTLAYDADNRVVSETVTASGGTGGFATAYSHDANGNRISATDALGNTTLFEYDGFDRLIGSTAPDGTRTSFSLDQLGRAVRTDISSSGGILVSRADASYSAYGKPVETRTWDLDSDGNPKPEGIRRDRVTHYAYDAGGNLTGTADALGHGTSVAYDASGRAVSVTDALGNSATAEYDAAGNAVRKRSVGNDGREISAYSEFDRDGRTVRTWQALS